eukprot:8719870-Pyramimonas_sp.AAC.1
MAAAARHAGALLQGLKRNEEEAEGRGGGTKKHAGDKGGGGGQETREQFQLAALFLPIPIASQAFRRAAEAGAASAAA